MVLFMGRKDQGIKHFTAGNGGVVSQVGIDQPGPVFQLRMGGHYETYCLNAIEDPAAKSYNSIYQFTAFTDL